jgi:ADP-ribose pyrophosphatase
MKLPKQAKRVFKGVIFDVYQWPQKMFDGSMKPFEMLKRTSSVRVIATQGNKILLNLEQQVNTKPYYGTFGGRMDKGETPLQTAKRELKEESGMESSDWKELFYYEPYDKMDFQVHVFVARNCKKVAEQNLDSGEKISIKSVSFNEFIKIVASDRYIGNHTALYMLRMCHQGKIRELKKKILS